jgi:hypothetical protein
MFGDILMPVLVSLLAYVPCQDEGKDQHRQKKEMKFPFIWWVRPFPSDWFIRSWMNA